MAIPLRGVQAPDQEKHGRKRSTRPLREGCGAAVCKRVAFSLVRGPRSGVGSADVSRSKAYRDNVPQAAPVDGVVS